MQKKSEVCLNNPNSYRRELRSFMQKINADKRPQKVHKAMLWALVSEWVAAGFSSSIQVNRRTLMNISGIKGLATYHKNMQELHDWGFIFYKPSYNPFLGSTIVINPANSTLEV